MYNDNIRQISNLTETNNIIRNSMLNGLNNLSENNRTNRSRRNRNYRNHRNQHNRYQQTNNSVNGSNSTNNSSLNNRPFNSNYYTPNYYTPNYYTPNYYTPNYYTPNYYTPNYYTPNYYIPHYYLPNYYRNNFNYNVRTPYTIRSTSLQSETHPQSLFYRESREPREPREPTRVLSNQSRRQISESTEQLRYGELLYPMHTVCPISHEPFNENSQVTVIRHCGHIFNTSELNTWFENHFICPVCRYDIRNYRSNSNLVSRRAERNNQSVNTFIDSSNNRSENDSFASDMFIILNSILTLDASYNNLSVDSSNNINDNILPRFLLRRSNRY
jgi:hypothetical protein